MTSDSDWIEAEREHERKMRHIEYARIDDDQRHERYMAQQRTERVQAWVVGLVVVLSLLGIVFAVWSHVENNGVRSAEVEKACIEAGGTWTPIGGTTNSPVCIGLTEIKEVDQ